MSRKSDGISAALEDYLETIHGLISDTGVARVRDIAEALSVHKSTVTAALRTLAAKGFINYSPYELISLTASGEAVAIQVRHRHTILEDFLRGVLRIEGSRAKSNACRMEHVVDSVVLDRMVQFARFIKECPKVGDQLLSRFSFFAKNQDIAAVIEGGLDMISVEHCDGAGPCDLK